MHKFAPAGADAGGARWQDKHRKLIQSTAFPASFSRTLDMSKIHISVLKPWIVEEVTKMLGFEDDVLVEFIFELLSQPQVDPKDMQIQLTGFLEDNAAPFMKRLWALMLSAQDHGGVPKSFIEKKKLELKVCAVGLAVFLFMHQ